MTLNAGATLSHYRLVEQIGEGGMGVVWRAADQKLGRDVAIKVLPAAFDSDPERLARLEREARSLASLNHVNVAAIYGFDEQEGLHFLVLELVPGDTLEQRLAHGPLPVDEAAELAMQIADGMAAAHDAGILHRDLKPANIKITPDGQVKVLDFGLAKAMAPGEASGNVSLSPTITRHATIAGTLMGTASYMSPEQARARALDRRSDLWSFGCVVFEMLTGKVAFPGETVSDIIARILQTEPDWSQLPAGLPRGIERLLRRCLIKDRNNRARDAGEARLAIREALEVAEEVEQTAAAEDSPATRTTRRRWLAPTIVAILATLIGVAVGRAIAPQTASESRRVARLELPLPRDRPLAAGSFLNPIAISPDGGTLVYVGAEAGVRRLYQRPLDRLTAEVIPGTEGAEGPFFSPSGEEIGFWAQGRLQRVSLSGGLPRPIFSTFDFRGGLWVDDDTIVFAPSQDTVLWRVSPDGSDPAPFTDASSGLQQRFPSMLPGGRRILFGALGVGDNFALDNAILVAFEIDTGKSRIVAEGVGIDARYADGHLFYVQAGTLLALPFDPWRLEVTGPPVTVQQGVRVQGNTGAAQFALAPDGSLAYLPGEVIGDDIALAWVDRDGNTEYFSDDRDVFRWPTLTADGSQLTVLIIGEQRQGRWISSVDTPGLTRLSEHNWPTWAPDGRHAAIAPDPEPNTPQRILYTDAFEKGEPEEVLVATNIGDLLTPTSISPDGRTLLFGMQDAVNDIDVFAIDLDGDAAPRPVLDSEFVECAAQFSPDGKWVAYVSDATGRFEVYITDWPANRIRRQISTNGGREPLWSSTGEEIFFRSGERMLAAGVRSEKALEVSPPRVLFTGDYEGALGFPNTANYAVAPDGRFLMLRSEELGSTTDRIAILEGAIANLSD